MPERTQKKLVYKLMSIFSVVRGYNILVMVIAQYLASIFIFASEYRALDVLFDGRLFLLIMSSSLAIASGYIINNFYDSEKDVINRPNKSMIDKYVSRYTKFRIYFALNFISTALAWIVSFRAAIFISSYIFLLWLYSHKLKKIFVVGNIVASVLALLPFFAITIYYHNYYLDVFTHATFLFFVVLIREIVKDLENIKGDFVNNYQTIPVKFGSYTSKKVITFLVLCALLTAVFLIFKFEVGYMKYYFFLSIGVLFVFLVQLWKAQNLKDYHRLHLALKVLLGLGVLSVVLIEPQVLLNAKKII